MARQRTKAQVRVGQGVDPNQLIGPIKRSDLIAVACFVGAGYLFVAHRWPVTAALCILAGMFAGLSPRMEDTFGFMWGNARIGGKFISPSATSAPTTRARLPTPRPPPARTPGPGPAPHQRPRPESPPDTGPDGD